MTKVTSAEQVQKVNNGDVTIAQIKRESNERVEKNMCKLFVGFMLCNKLNQLIDEGDITEREVDIFYSSVLKLHRTTFIFAIDSFPLVFAACTFLGFLQLKNLHRKSSKCPFF